MFDIRFAEKEDLDVLVGLYKNLIKSHSVYDKDIFEFNSEIVSLRNSGEIR